MKIYKYISILVLVFLCGCKVGLEPITGSISNNDTLPPTIVAISSVGNQTISIAWADVEEASDYVIFRDDTEIASDTRFTYDDAGLTNGQKYCYEVTARAGEKRSVPSNTVCAVPIGIPEVEAIPGTLSARLDWDDVAGAESYNVYRRDGDSEELVEEGTTENSSRVEGLSNNCVTYDFKIVPVDGDGRETSEEIEWVSVEPLNVGVVDETFDEDGLLQLAPGGSFTDVAVLRDGTILALISTTQSKLVGYDEFGNLLWETIFSGDGHDLANANAFVVDSQERVIVVGSDKVCRLLPTDSGYVFDEAGFGFDYTDASTSNGCSTTSPFDIGLIVNDVTIDSQGRILIVGLTGSSSAQLSVLRLEKNGKWDKPFEYNQVATFNTNTIGYSIIAVLDGSEEKIYAVGIKITGVDMGSGATVSALLLAIDENGDFLSDHSMDILDCNGKDIIQLLNGNVAVLTSSCDPALAKVSLFSPSLNLLDSYTYNYPEGNNESQVCEQNCREGLLVGGDAAGPPTWLASVFRTDANFLIDDLFAVDGWYLSGEQGRVNAIAFDSLGRLILAGNLGAGNSATPTLWRLK